LSFRPKGGIKGFGSHYAGFHYSQYPNEVVIPTEGRNNEQFGTCYAEERGILLKHKIIKVMKAERDKFYIYIVTNPTRKVLYTGVTNDLAQRITEHWRNRGSLQTFAGRYFCFQLIHYEEFRYINDAIAREKEIKGWRREKKVALICTKNPGWNFLNVQICGCWPPENKRKRF
jgi:putative endonuclease